MGSIWCFYILLAYRTSLDSIGVISMGEIFLVGVVVIILLVMAEEFFEAYDEWRNDDDEL